MKSLELCNTRRKRAWSELSVCLIGVLSALSGCGESPTLPAPADVEDLERQGAASVYGKLVPVILVVMDALDANHVTHLGYERDTTPNMDAFAKDGVSFRAAFSPAPYTVAGIGALLSGRRPDTTGLYTKLNMLRDDEQTIASLLSRHEYKTRALVSNPNGGMRFGALRGFDEVSPLYEAADGAEPNFTTRDGVPVHLPQAKEHLPLMRAFLDEVPEGKPFFFYSHMLEPHSPYVADEPFRSKYLDPNYAGPFLKGDTDDLLDTVYGRLKANPEDRLAINALYDGHLAFADDSFGHLMDDLKARGLYDKSLIILTGDHGEAMFQHDRWGHNDQIYDEMVHVPLLIKLPGSEGPRNLVLDGLVSTMDVLPTICESLDIPAGALALDGKSIYEELVTGMSSPEDRGLFLRTHHSKPDVGLRTLTGKGIFLQSEEGGAVFEYFDLVQDPGEANNQGASNTPEVKAMRKAILDELIRVKRSRRTALRNDNAEDDQDTLSALGYTDEVNAAGASEDSEVDPFEGMLPESLKDANLDD